MTTDKQKLGSLGEEMAAEFYEQRGYRIRDHNISYSCGELDLIAQAADGTVVFVEVKTRSSAHFGIAESVTAGKFRRMRGAAVNWLQDKPYSPIRFDVITVVMNERTGQHTVDCYEGIDHGAG